MARDSKGGWLLYCMINFPLIFIFKVGITSLSIGAKTRAKAIDKAMPGIPIPILVVPVPGAYYVEQALHGMMRKTKFSFYKGDGHTETFILAPLFIAVPIMLMIWAVYLYLIDLCLHTTILPTVSKWFFDFINSMLGA